MWDGGGGRARRRVGSRARLASPPLLSRSARRLSTRSRVAPRASPAGAHDLAINGELRELSVAGGGGYALGSSAALADGGAGDENDDDAASVAAMAASAWYRLGWQLLRPRVAIAVLCAVAASCLYVCMYATRWEVSSVDFDHMAPRT